MTLQRSGEILLPMTKGVTIAGRLDEASAVEYKYSPDQARDDAGRFGFGGGEAHSHGGMTHTHPKFSTVGHTHVKAGQFANHWALPGRNARLQPEPAANAMRSHLRDEHGLTHETNISGSRYQNEDDRKVHDRLHGRTVSYNPDAAKPSPPAHRHPGDPAK